MNVVDTHTNLSTTAFPGKAFARNTLVSQVLRYLVVGGMAFVIDFGLLYLLTRWLGVYYLTSALISYVAGTLVNYALSVSWVFETRSLKDARLELLAFAVIGLVGLAMNEVVLLGLTGGLGLHYLHSKLLSTGGVLVWNFTARKVLLFS